MKSKILFVDDESLVLEGLKRCLYPMRHEWDMHFVVSAKEALDYLAHTNCDVVVSDMRMPGMNGAELLDRVMILYPKTLRFILSGHSDKSLILQCVKSAHQFLCKPCNPEELKGKLSNALNRGAVENAVVSDIVSKIEMLPSMLSVYNEITAAMKNPSVSAYEIADIVGKDVAMTANLLKMVNSSFYGVGRKISSIIEAINYLGFEPIRSLVLVIGAFGNFEPEQSIWQHCCETAAMAKSLCYLETKNRKLAQECFVGGMLHDIGKLGLATHLRFQYNEAVLYASTERVISHIAEQRVFGTNHAELGSSLLGRWGLPQTLLDAIAFHHYPSRGGFKDVTSLTFVHAANALIHQQSTNDMAVYAHEIDMNYLESIGLQSRIKQWKTICLNQLSKQ